MGSRLYRIRRGRGGLLLHSWNRLRRIQRGTWWTRTRRGHGGGLVLNCRIRLRRIQRDNFWRWNWRRRGGRHGGGLLLHLELVRVCTTRPAVLMPSVLGCSPRKEALDEKVPASRLPLLSQIEKLARGVVHATPTLVVVLSNPALGARGLVLQLERCILEEVPLQSTPTEWSRSLQLSLASQLQRCQSASWWGCHGESQRALVSAGNGRPGSCASPVDEDGVQQQGKDGQVKLLTGISSGNSENNGSRLLKGLSKRWGYLLPWWRAAPAQRRAVCRRPPPPSRASSTICAWCFTILYQDPLYGLFQINRIAGFVPRTAF